MPGKGITRRRAITILVGAACTLKPATVRAGADTEWHGVAMGADASILFSGVAEDAARAAIESAVGEIERLEGALSLFREDSELSRLNRAGALAAPSLDLRRALALALAVAKATNGVFDPTVQALWEAHVDWFSRASSEEAPPQSVITAARQFVDWQRITLTPEAVRLGKAQRITLNGLGQGYVTDRVADILRGQGLKRVLVDLGEQRALGARHDETPWRIARDGAAPFMLTHGALATSEGAGLVFGANGAAHHLFDPRTGRSATRWRRVTVHHRSAAVADALSTAFYAMSAREIEQVLPTWPGLLVWAADRDGRETRWRAPSEEKPGVVTL
jgi:thiamine biosynthesis lipoprotein